MPDHSSGNGPFPSSVALHAPMAGKLHSINAWVHRGHEPSTPYASAMLYRLDVPSCKARQVLTILPVWWCRLNIYMHVLNKVYAAAGLQALLLDGELCAVVRAGQLPGNCASAGGGHLGWSILATSYAFQSSWGTLDPSCNESSSVLLMGMWWVIQPRKCNKYPGILACTYPCPLSCSRLQNCFDSLERADLSSTLLNLHSCWPLSEALKQLQRFAEHAATVPSE